MQVDVIIMSLQAMRTAQDVVHSEAGLAVHTTVVWDPEAVSLPKKQTFGPKLVQNVLHINTS